MPRIDDYRNARRLAVEKLARESFDSILRRSGFERAEADRFRVPFLDRIYRVDYPQFEFTDLIDPAREIPIQEQVLILHYLAATEIPPLSGRWVSYREIPGASFYFGAFVKRAVDPLKKVFGQDSAGFIRAAAELQGNAVESGDVGFEFRVLPAVPLRLILWAGDAEFTAEAGILFDDRIGRILTPEDIAWLAGMLVYRLIALSR